MGGARKQVSTHGAQAKNLVMRVWTYRRVAQAWFERRPGERLGGSVG